MRTRRSLLATMGAVPAIFLPASLAFAQSSKDRVVAALGSDVATLDPTINHAIISYNARINIFDALTDIGPNNNPIPRFATHWEESPDAKTWTFTIRTGAKFHNGDPVTIDDVIYSYQKIMDDERSPTRIHVNHIATIDRISDTQLRFNLHAPFAPFARTASIICVISKRAYQEMGADAFGKRPVGSGPYKVVNWIKDDRIELQAFDDWWGGAPVIKSVWMRAVPSEASRSAALLSGEVDIVPQTPPALIQTLGNRPGIKVKTGDGYKVVFLGFNPANRNLADLKMRQAIDMAIDRNAITKQLLRGLAVPTGTDRRQGQLRPRRQPRADHVRSRARQAAHQGGGLSRRTNPPAVSQRLHRVSRRGGHGHRAVISATSASTSSWRASSTTPSIRRGWSESFPASTCSSSGPTPRCSSPIFSIFVSKGRRRLYFTDHVDELAEAARSAADPHKRAQLIADLWAASDAYKPFAFLYNEGQASAMRSDIESGAAARRVRAVLESPSHQVAIMRNSGFAVRSL